MHPDDPNFDRLCRVAEALDDLREDLVFVGGSVAGLLVTDELAVTIRSTLDVDALIPVVSLAQYRAVESRLAACGFVQGMETEVICRWRHKESGAVLDVMPDDPKILGFSNPWYPEAIRSANEFHLRPDLGIRLIAPPAFIATKLEAFIDRGGRDLFSHDLEDVLNVVDGRPEIVDEMKWADEGLRAFVAGELGRLLANPDFSNALPGLLEDELRVPVVLERFRLMSQGLD